MTTYQTSEVTIETLPPLRVACLRVSSTTPEQDGRERLKKWIVDNCHQTGSRKFGFVVEVTPNQQRDGLRGYEVWETVPETTQSSGEIQIQYFAGGRYAVMTLDRCFEDPFELIPNGWKTLHNWVINSKDYQSAGHQWLEEVLEMDYGETLKLYHPIMDTI